jgi:uncharacterized protein (TIGR02246 family)
MRFSTHVPVFALLVASLAGAREESPRAVQDLVTRWQAAFNQRDFQSVADLYTEDAIWFGNTGAVSEGRKAILAEAQEPLPIPPGEGTIELTTLSSETFGDTAYVVGSYVIAAPDGAEMVRGHYMAVLKLVDGAWQIYRHLSNLVMPQPAPDTE